MNAIEQIQRILDDATADNITLRADVFFGSPERCVMTGHHYHGEEWQRYEYSDTFEFTLGQLTAVIDGAGWRMPQRPVKQQGFAFHYVLQRQTQEERNGYTAHHVAGEVIERNEREMRFREIEMVQEAFS